MGRIPSSLLMIMMAGALAWSPASHAGSQFGIFYGLSVPDYENTKHYYAGGIKGMAFVTPTLSLGGYFMQSDTNGEKSVNEKFRYSLTGLDVAYHTVANTGDTYAAFRVGMSKIEHTQDDIDMIFSPYHYGVALGYDHYIGANFAIGFEGSYLHAQPGRTYEGGVPYETKSFNIISFLVALQFRM